MLGYGFLQNAIGDRSRLACTEILPDQTKTTAAFWRRTHSYVQFRGITVARAPTDNGSLFGALLGYFVGTLNGFA